MKTGFKDIDRFIGGLNKGELIILGGQIALKQS